MRWASLEYPITRPFPGKWFSTLSYAGAAIALAFLIALNSALTGYEVVTVFRADYNSTHTNWYNKWLPSSMPSAGGQCDSHIFNTGDAFTTNYTLFQWSIETIVRANAGTSGIEYTGSTLENCDITALYINGDIRTWTIDVTAIAGCSVMDKFEMTARTDFAITMLPGKHTPLLGLAQTTNYTQGEPRAIALDIMMNLAAEEIADRVSRSVALNGDARPVALSVEAIFPDRCPAQLASFRIENAAALYSNGRIQDYDAAHPIDNETNPQALTDDNRLPVENIIQTLHAALRIDLGNPNPNNIFLFPQEATKLVLAPEFPASSGLNSTASLLYLTGSLPSLAPVEFDKHMSDFIRVVYLCRHQQRKPLAQAAVSVIVATLSMFSGGWAVFILVATYFVKSKYKQANVCLEHGFGTHPEMYEPREFDSRWNSEY
ncbi:hypothetical protein BD779DRAFT_1508712 [Infundibulicybe gibba]|nr:hypothetical protein BD779DRAFT_1508712 [Infundibulicybe gibba]